MMDKAKAYDEALEKARQDRDAYQKELDKTDKNSQLASILKAGISALEMVFPQLKDSDNDRIRKCLHDIVNWFSFDSKFFTNNFVTKKDVIAYLEKQKGSLRDFIDDFPYSDKSKVDIDKLRRDLYQSGYNDGYQHGKEDAQKQQESIPNTYGCLNCTKLEECEKGLTPCSGHRLKIVDQKPADDKAFEEWIDSWFKEHKEKAYPQITMDEKEFKNFCRGIRNMYQQKSDWNEEDERMLSRCIKSIECSKKFADSETYKTAKDAEINWLKDIFLNHKKFNEAVDKLWSNDWSEEDEKTINDACCFLGEYAGYIGSKNWGKSSMLFSIVDKLKSLYPYWKPSEEQMKALEKAIVRCQITGLESLYEDLKKLM